MLAITTRRAILASALAGALAFSLLPGAAQAQSRTLKLSHHLAPGHLVDVASKRFAELVSQNTNGEVTVEVYPAGQLAGLRQGAEGVQVGTLDFAWTDFGTLANWRPELGFVSLPFLFKDVDHALKVFNGEIGDELRTLVRDSLGVEILGYGIAGFRVIATRDKPVNVPEDLRGVKLRVPEVPVFVSSFETVGANPTPMAWGEVYTAIQTGVIDGAENPAEGLVSGKIQEVTKHLSKTYHIMTDVNLVMSKATMDSLTPAQQEAIRAAAKTAVDEYNTASIAADSKFWDQLAATMTTNDNPDREAFRQAMLPVWDEFDKTAGGAGKPWIDRVVAAGQ